MEVFFYYSFCEKFQIFLSFWADYQQLAVISIFQLTIIYIQVHATAIHHSSSSSSDSKADQHVEAKASHLQSHDFSHKQGSYTFRRVKVPFLSFQIL